MRKYLLKIQDGQDPIMGGPFHNDETVLEFAKDIRGDCDSSDGFFAIEINRARAPKITKIEPNQIDGSDNMAEYNVSVEKTMYCTGHTVVRAYSSGNAIDVVNDKILSGELQYSDIEWSDAEYEDNSFKTTGDVD
jgi:hypothetical protein